MQHWLVFTGILSVTVFVVATIRIYVNLKDSGGNVSFVWLRLCILPYVSRYRKITKEETGKVGYLFYLWLISINIALGCTLLLLFVFKG